MAKRKEPTLDQTISPLFNKMDALLARHRGPTGGEQDIPVLTDVAAVPEIPVLTEEVPLMFAPAEFSAPQKPSPGIVPGIPLIPQTQSPTSPGAWQQSPLAATEPVFLNLPTLDLDALPLGDEVDAGPLFELEVDEAEAAVLPAPIEALVVHAAAPGLVALVDEPLVHEALVLDEVLAEAPSVPSVEPQHEEGVLELQSHDEYHVDLDLDESLEVVPVADAAPSAPRLGAAEVEEITAHVAAHLAVDISTEVTQLARQHFTRIMNGYYQQALQQLTDEISRDMEEHMTPRIVELVRAELVARGLIEP